MEHDYRKYCQWCGRPFTTHHRTEKFCCHGCEDKAKHHIDDIRQERTVFEASEEYRYENERLDR